MRQIHTIPVPPGMSAEQAWERISREDWFTPADYGKATWVEVQESDAAWLSVEVAGGRMVAVLS